MKAPLWKKYLSYLFEMHLESRSSEYNPELHVSIVDGRYQLFTENAIYSFADLYHNFRKSFELIQLDKYPIDKVLVLGLGLGSIPYMLENIFQKKYHYTHIEIDEEVIDLANKYVLQYLEAPQQMICTDAYAFVEVCQEKFDLITVDLFLDNIIPAKFEEISFLENLSQRLNPNGILFINRMADTPYAKERSQQFLEEKFLKVFTSGGYLDVGKNWMFTNVSNDSNEGNVLNDNNDEDQS